MSKKLRLIAMACILFALPVFFCANASALTTKVTLVAQDDIKVYTSSSLSTEKGTLYFGDEITYTSKGSTYTKVTVTESNNSKLKGKIAYIASSKLNPDSSNPNFKYPRYIETSGSQKLRKTSSTSSTSYGYIARGTEMEVLGIVKNSKGTYMLKVRGVKTFKNTSNTTKWYDSKSGYTKKSYGTKKYSHMVLNHIVRSAKTYADSGASTVSFGMDMGDEITVYNKNEDWAQISIGGKKRYIPASYVEDLEKYVTAKSVYLRRTASTSSSSNILSTIYWNEKVLVHFTRTVSSKQYAYVTYDGKTGWIQTKSGSTGKLGYNESRITDDNAELCSTSDMNNHESYIRITSKVTVEMIHDNIAKVALKTCDGFIHEANLKYHTENIARDSDAYSKASTLSKYKTGSIAEGTTVKVIASSLSLGWSYVEAEGHGKCYVRNGSLAYDIPTPDLSNSGPNTRYVAESVIKLYRNKPTDDDFIQIRYLEPVEYIKRCSASSDYYMVEYQGEPFYIYSTKGIDAKLLEEYPVYASEDLNNTQKAILREAFDILYNRETTYVKSGKGDPDGNGIWEFDCSNFVAYVINTCMSPLEDSGIHWKVPTAVDGETGDNNLFDATHCDAGKDYPATIIWKKGSSSPWDKNIKPGDVMLFHTINGYTNRDATHAAIYVGNGDYIHCTEGCVDANKVVISHLAKDGRDKYAGGDIVMVKRFIPDPDDIDLLA